jgi:hypothetical protein
MPFLTERSRVTIGDISLNDQSIATIVTTTRPKFPLLTDIPSVISTDKSLIKSTRKPDTYNIKSPQILDNNADSLIKTERVSSNPKYERWRRNKVEVIVKERPLSMLVEEAELDIEEPVSLVAFSTTTATTLLSNRVFNDNSILITELTLSIGENTQ